MLLLFEIDSQAVANFQEMLFSEINLVTDSKIDDKPVSKPKLDASFTKLFTTVQLTGFE